MVLFILLILLELIYKNILQRHITKPQEYLLYKPPVKAFKKTFKKIFQQGHMIKAFKKIFNMGRLKIFKKLLLVLDMGNKFLMI